MDFLRKQQGNEKSHTVEGDKVNSAIDGLIEKVGMFAILYFHRKSGVAYIGWYNNDTCY